MYYAEVLYRQGWHVRKAATEEEANALVGAMVRVESWPNNPNPPRDHRVRPASLPTEPPVAPSTTFDESW